MELQGQRLIPAPVATTWAALNDPAVLKACIAGCDSLERTAENAFAAVVAVKVGPVSARFRGNLEMTNVQAPTRYTINFEGQGGVAGFGKGAADVTLAAEGPDRTTLAYVAKAQVGGKLAQVGSRLIDAAAGKITDDFFKAFEALLQSRAAPAGAAVEAPAMGAAAAGSTSATAAAPSHPASATPGVTFPLPAPSLRRPSGTLEWVLAALVVLALAYFLAR